MSLTKALASSLSGFDKGAVTQELTAATLLKIIDEVNNDPLAGMGSLSKKEILVDRIMAQWRICAAKMRGVPARFPASLNPDENPAPEQSTTAISAARVAKSAGM